MKFFRLQDTDLWWLVAAVILGGGGGMSAANKDAVQFNRDIRPIMSDTCFHCHGPDKNSRKGGMRLDIREEALKPAKSGAIPIVPGKPEESEIIKRLFTSDKDDLMPPPEAHKELTSAQKELIKKWVAEGAKYEMHWAYTPLVRPAVPVVKEKAAVKNPIDAYILARLEELKISPSREADKRMLLRRLSLDLTGLPATPEETKAFLADTSNRAYERQVDRLLKSPRFGERMAVWWLDVARYTDTVGYHGDQNQRIFPYRDYVIDAFNQNKPFNQFTLEQIAGDLLPNPTPEQITASGFNRLNMMTREGGAQPKEYLAKYNAERVRTIGGAWLGATLGCCECHDHKFDPYSQKDFYSLQAFFGDLKQWGVYSDYGYTKTPELVGWSNEHPFPPEALVDSPYLKRRQARFEKQLGEHLAATTAKLRADGQQSLAYIQWLAESRVYLQEHPEGWITPTPAGVKLMKDGKASAYTNAVIDSSAVIHFSKKPGKGEEFRIDFRPASGRMASLRLEAIPGKKEEEKLANGAQKTGLKLSLSVKGKDGKERKLTVYHAEADFKDPRYQATAEVIGVKSGWKLSTKYETSKQTSVWLLDAPVELGPDDTLSVELGGDTVVPVRFSISPFGAEDPMQTANEALRKALLASPRKRTAAQEQLLVNTYLFSTAWDAEAFARFKSLHAEVLECRNGKAWTMVAQAMEPMTIRVLPRGNWMDESGAIVSPASPHFLPGVASTEQNRLTRLDLAKWLCSAENPLTPRAVMNRLWKQYFGNGISAVVDDLGAQGEPPSHPELLDWLAAEFRDSGWDVKHMVKLFVMSGTYRQSSSLRPELKEVDPNNRLLASQNPRRLDAEFVRDNALFIAGMLNLDDVGGPSVYPYQPPGYYANLQFPDRDYVANTDEREWRRGVYMHWQRTFLHPMLANFDAPPRDECTANRNVSNTPQQALTLLNDPTFVEAARVFAARILKSNLKTDEAKLDLAFQLAVDRPIKPKERDSLKAFLATQRAEYRADDADAAKLLKIGLEPQAQGIDRTELAAWATVCRVVLNLQETITRY